MAQDLFQYEKMVERALRGVVRDALLRAARDGLRGAHHFYIGFATQMPGVVIPDHLRAKYPDEMSIVLQHQFWDLAVTDAHFEVALSFNGVSEKLHVPFEAIKGFFDPSVQFGLQFEPQQAEAGDGAEKPAVAEEKAARPRRKGVVEEEAPAAVGPAEPPKPAKAPEKKSPVALVPKDEPEPDKPGGGAEVVRLDRFRKK